MEGQDDTHTNGVSVENEDVFADYDKLSDLCESNADYYKNDTSTVGKKIHKSLLSIVDNLILIRPLLEYYREICPKYDFDENSRGNGYRSYVLVTDAFIRHGVKVNKQIFSNRNSYFFRRGTALKELEVIDQGVCSLLLILTHLQELVTWGDPPSLYPREEHAPEEILYRANNLNQYCFYGRSLGFQFCDSMHTVLKGLGILMASFSEIYYSGGGVFERATSSLWNSSKYLVNPELRAKRIVNISQYASVNFCKQFWFLGENEMMKRLPNLVSASVGVNRIISIPPEPLTIDRVDGTPLQVPIPSAHIGPSPLDVRLMSALKYEGMMGEANSKGLKPPSRGLFFHCHGGGFVAQSSRSHEAYLCQWAKSIGVPILSIDYNLAPEAPFPRALDDIFYAYCWALKNAALLGTTAERIVVGGDSAGGTLSLCLTLKCIQMGVRPPDGIFLAYTPVVVSFVPSPARLLCLMDPLLPLGFLAGCLRAYACTPEAYAAAVKGYEEKLCHSYSVRPGLEESKRSYLSKLNTVNSAAPVTEIDYTAEEMKENDPPQIENYNGYVHSTNVTNKEETIKEENVDAIFDKYVAHEANGIVPENGIEENGEEKENIENGSINGNGIANGKSPTANTTTVKSPAKERPLSESASVDEDFEETLPIPVEMVKFAVPNDPLLSPYLASDEDLKHFPPSCFVTLHMDPCLDDCVEMAKKLKRLGTDVHLDVLEGLPHGFLNFSLLSKEAYEASKLCIERIKSLLNLPTDVEEAPTT